MINCGFMSASDRIVDISVNSNLSVCYKAECVFRYLSVTAAWILW